LFYFPTQDTHFYIDCLIYKTTEVEVYILFSQREIVWRDWFWTRWTSIGVIMICSILMMYDTVSKLCVEHVQGKWGLYSNGATKTLIVLNNKFVPLQLQRLQANTSARARFTYTSHFHSCVFENTAFYHAK